MKYLFLFITFLLSISCSEVSDEHGSRENNKSIYEFVNYILENEQDKLSCKFMYDHDGWFEINKNDSLSLTRLDTIFTKADLDTIFNQYNNLRDFKFRQEYISKKIVSYDTLQSIGNSEMFYERIGKRVDEGICWASVPLFSKDGNIAIIRFGYSTGTFGYEEWNIYRRGNERWTLIMNLSRSIG